MTISVEIEPVNFVSKDMAAQISSFTQLKVSHEFLTAKAHAAKNPKQELLSLSEANDVRLSDPNFICFRIEDLEFFCPTIAFKRHSGYFSRHLKNREYVR